MRGSLSTLIAFSLTAPVFAQTPPASAPAPAPAQAPKADAPDQGGAGDLLIAPTRLLMEKGQRVTEVALFNQGSAPNTYRVSLLRTGMNEDGSVVEIPEPPAGTLDPLSLFRFSPHEVKLEPGETQVVRFALRMPGELPDGEYRVHVRFIGLPQVEAPKAKSDEAPKGLTAIIKPVFGVSIPLIFRKGDLSAKATLSKPALGLNGEKRVLNLDLRRDGNASLYGDFKVFFTPAGGASQPVGELNGIAVYTPLALRHVVIPLNPPAGVSLQHGSFAVSFVDGKSQATLGTTVLAVP